MSVVKKHRSRKDSRYFLTDSNVRGVGLVGKLIQSLTLFPLTPSLTPVYPNFFQLPGPGSCFFFSIPSLWLAKQGWGKAWHLTNA